MFGAALLAFVVGNALLFFTVIMIVNAVAMSFATGLGKSAPTGGSVLVIDLPYGMVDSPDNSYGSVDFNSMSVISAPTTLEVATALQTAAEDPAIRGIYMNVGNMGGMGYAQTEELRSELLKFKKSGKFIVAYNDYYTQGTYWLSSVADKVFVNPEGSVDWRGVAANVLFFKNMLDKLGIHVDVVRHGAFKSAVEPYIMNGMSQASRLQMEHLVEGLWNVMVDDVAASRGVAAEDLRRWADGLEIPDADAAVEKGLVDGKAYADDINGLLDWMCEGNDPAAFTASEEGHDEAATISISDYIMLHQGSTGKYSHNRIAVIYADGQIVDGESYSENIGGDTLAEQIREARTDDNVKAVVLRVNSPGGSALASETIWHEAALCRERKPFVVSMGDAAASGGYYISSPADVILADRTTQTGSIGVFGLLLNAGDALQNKLGITVDVVKSAPSADMGSIVRGITPAERRLLEGQIERTYSTFVGHVAEGRNMSVAAVDSIGQGRVWLGADAASNGLVDGIGNLSDAIALAADRAGIETDYMVYEITGEEDAFRKLMSLFAAKAGTAVTATENGIDEAIRAYGEVRSMLGHDGIMARAPFILRPAF